MRLIDADELKEAMEEHTDYKGYLVCDPEEIIDLAPTVEQRPHGEWIKVEFRTKEEKMFYGDAYKCSHCKVISDTHGNAPYCENCGASMSTKGGDEE